VKYKLYHGTSPYLSLEIAHKHIDELHKKYPTTTLILLDADHKSSKELLDTISSPSLFSTKRILFLKRIYRNKEKSILIDEILSILKNQNSDDILIFWEDQKIKSNTKYYKFFKENKSLEEVDALNKRTFFSWLRSELEKNSLKIDPAIIKELAERTNYDPERCANEIKKFKLNSTSMIIRKEDLEELTSDTLERDIWDLIESINQEDRIASMEILEKLIKQSVDENYILSMLVRNLRLLTLTKFLSEKRKDYREISSILKIPPFTTPTLVKSSQKYSNEKLVKLYTKLSNLDYQIKTGKVDAKLGLTLICPYL